MLRKMDSPEVENIKGLRRASTLMTESIPMNTDDSGYITVTPSSADLTAVSGSNSRRLFLSRKFNSTRDVRHNSLSTPRGKRSNRPKQIQEYFMKKTDIVSSEHSISVDDNIDSNAFGDKIDSAVQPTVGFMEWSEESQAGSMKFSSNSGSDKCIKNVLPALVVSDFTECQSTSVFEFKGDTASSQPVAHATFNSSNISQSPCSSILRLNMHSQGIFKSNSNIEKISPITEAFSYSDTPYKYTSKDKFRNSLQLTPESNEYLSSPILKRDYLLHKSSKKLNCDSQKIGTPEKNFILYSNLKPVNFPKKIKSPEKLRSTSVSSTKCRKKLFSIKEKNSKSNYSGQECIDFLKMLGEQQNHVPAVKSILSCLSCKDLMKVCCVSKTWNKVCCNDVRAASRKRIYARQIEMQKENIDAHLQMSPNKKSKLDNDPIPCSAKGHKMLAEIDNNNRNRMNVKPQIQRSPPVSPGKRKFKTHMNVVMKHPESSIRQCLRCRKPATVSNHWATCSGLDCGFRFCTRCSSEYSKTYVCCQRSIQSVSPSKDSHSKLYIGTKKSRRNLLRL